MTMPSQRWTHAFQAFLDRRALIMFFLGFSAGIPILLIFSSLSLWLGEAGIAKSAVTFFSWAALGYSFKFVWAPLIDEIPIPILTNRLGRRRAWLFVAQIMIVIAIMIMALTDPASGQQAVIQMAIGAVLLGFSAATQDIVIDAYRIELGDAQIQTVLASTYNAGYRIGMIVAGAGALFLASWLGTSKGNYIYSAWKWTYLTMALVMCIGIITTLLIREPRVNRVQKDYQAMDYFRLVAVFSIAVASFVISYMFLNQLVEGVVSTFTIQDNFLLFSIETIRFLIATFIAMGIGWLLIRLGVVKKQMAIEIWVNPIQDFFSRYGLKLALALLLLIGFYRISDIIAGVISNVFYQDLNFTKEEIAKAVKVYGVIFSLVGGFLGGLLAQRVNIMKLMFVGAVLASTTNLMFVGLVKSGKDLSTVQIDVGPYKYSVLPDDVGYFEMNVPSDRFNQQDHIQISTQYSQMKESTTSIQLPVLTAQKSARLQLMPFNAQNTISALDEQKEYFIKGQYLVTPDIQLGDQPITVHIADQKYPAKIDKSGQFSVGVALNTLLKNINKHIEVTVYDKNNNVLETSMMSYTIAKTAVLNPLSIEVKALPLIDPSLKNMVKIEGKVIKPYSSNWLYIAIIIDNLASGLAGAAFIAFLSSLTSVSFTAVQYAIFSSLMTLTPKILGGYSGTIVTHIGYPQFFTLTALMGIPILILVIWVSKLLNKHQSNL